MDVPIFQMLISPTGQAVLADAQALQPREKDFLRHFQVLQRKYPAELARAALETAILRLRAKDKFPDGERMYFTREALEQATPYPVAQHRAGRYRGLEGVFDLGCSIGGDSLALAEHTQVVGVDLDLLRLEMGRANLKALEKDERVAWLQADIRAMPVDAHIPRHRWGVFFDPARREGQRRKFSVFDYAPPLEIIRDWQRGCPACGVKLSPAVNLNELAEYEGEVEFVSLAGELKEAALWLGTLRSALRRATVLPWGHTLAVETTGAGPGLVLSEPQAWLYEPDPAVLRAGLVRLLGDRLGAAQLDEDIAYLTANRAQSTPFARAYPVLDWFPFGMKRLRSYLQARRIGRLVVKKRGSPLDPQALEKALRLKGEEKGLIFLTQLRGQPIVIISEPESSPREQRQVAQSDDT